MPGKGNKKPYLCAYTENIEAAAKDLTPVAFKLWLYFASNQNEYMEGFSSANFSDKYGCDIKSAKAAFNILIEKKYLVLADGYKKRYVFYEKPQTDNAITISSAIGLNLQKKRFVDEDTGEYYELTFKELVEACEGDKEIAKQLWEVA